MRVIFYLNTKLLTKLFDFKVLVTLLFVFSANLLLYGQDTLFNEDFSDDGQGAISGTEDGVMWSITCPSDPDFCGIDDNQDRIEFENLDGIDSVGETAEYSTGNINISDYGSFDIYIDLQEAGTLEYDDCIEAYYTIDGTETLIGTSCDDGLSDLSISISNNTGTNLSLRITAINNGSGEVLAITSVAVDNAILPVTYSKFSTFKNENNSILAFSTVSETNNDYFTIERSADARYFEAIGEIKGAGNSAEEKSYSFTDEKPLPGINYYRIKQTDFDGKYAYSEVKSVTHESKGGVMITPKSTNGQLTVATDLDRYDIVVYNIQGQSVASHKNLSKTQTISIEDLKSGIYYVEILGEISKESIKVVKF